MTTAKASGRTALASAIAGATRRPASAPSTAMAKGQNSSKERWSVSCTRLRPGQEEVEAEGCEAEREQRRVVAQVARLRGAHRGRERPHRAGRPAHEQPGDDAPLERGAPEAPEPRERPHDHAVDDLVEVPLVDEHAVQPGEV